MKIRRYMAKNTQEAILKVKMDLGSEALILNTRRVKKKGLLGLFAKPMVEVLAAIDEYNVIKTEGDKKKAEQKSMVPAETTKTVATEIIMKEESIELLENRIKNMEQIIQKIYPQVKFSNKPTHVQKDKKAADALQTANMFLNNLCKNDVDEEIVKRIIETAVSKLDTNAGINDMAAQLFNIISGILGHPDTIKPGIPGKPSVVIFVGPTGVGKTTTLAKIAANYLLTQKKSVGLITADTYRIAAVEQLKTYADILGIPVSVVYTAQEIKDAIGQHSDKDIILIDTAGRSHRNKPQFEELKALIKASEADEIYLVLSATSSISNCREVLENYNFLENFKLIFTKLDETPVQGIILNVSYLTGKNLSYITTGQSVPDDIETANIAKIAKHLIGSTAR